MRRVCIQGGSVIALAEPDYGGRIDYPQELVQLAGWQEASLRRQRADPRIGRQLGELFSSAGLQDIEVGVLGGQWKDPPPPDEWKSEWSVIRSDLEGYVDEAEIQRLQEVDYKAWTGHRRILFVPTFYAWGKAPV